LVDSLCVCLHDDYPLIPLFQSTFHCVLQVHVNLMLLEARMQAELLYALRAIMKHMT
jgi:hypothetical protein